MPTTVSHNTKRRRLIINADDFGRSHSINEAVIDAHRNGALTTASLMVNERSCDEAVRMARDNPRMGVGLHLALVCGKAALQRARIPNLVFNGGSFSENAVTSGMRFFFQRKLRQQLRDEIEAQFDRFHSTGLVMDHVNGHLNIHLHPTVFAILMENAAKWRIQHLRLTCDPFWLNVRLAGGNWLYRTSHAFIYGMLSMRSRPQLAARGIHHTGQVFGLLQNARVDESYILRLLPKLPPGDSELYSHPSLKEFRHEYEGLISPRVRQSVDELGIQLIRYQDL